MYRRKNKIRFLRKLRNIGIIFSLEHRRKKYYATSDIRQRHQQKIHSYREVSLLSCGEGENDWSPVELKTQTIRYYSHFPTFSENQPILATTYVVCSGIWSRLISTRSAYCK